MNIPKNQLKRGMWTYIQGPELGKVLIIISTFLDDIDALLLHENGNTNKTFTKDYFQRLYEQEMIEWVCMLPKDVFSNYKNTWKRNS
jgi:hypothetical protein